MELKITSSTAVSAASKSPRVGPYGPPNAKIMVVGEAPGADEVREGRPFVGAAGKLLRDVLASVGINPDEVYYTNLSKTRPEKNELSRFFDKKGVPCNELLPDLAELKAEIAAVNPNLIIPVGSYPLKFLTGKGKWDGNEYTGISTYRGSILEGTDFASRKKCLPTYHPAAALRTYSLKHIMRADCRRAAQQCEYPDIRRPRKRIIIDPTGADREAWIRWLVSPEGTESPRFQFPNELEWSTVKADSFLTSDIEYVGSRLLCLGATRQSDVAVVIATRTETDISDVRSILGSGIPLCFQNAMFDCSILEWFYNVRCIQHLRHDTMIAMHSCYTELPKDLGFIGSLFTEQPVWFDELDAKFWNSIRKKMEDQGELFGLSAMEQKYLPYNGIDVWVTHAAMKAMLSDELLDPDFARTYQHEMSLVAPLWEISKRGVAIDSGGLNTLKNLLETEAATLLAGLALLNGGAEVNVKSPPQVADFLYGKMGVPQTGPKTPTGRWKMNDDTLADLLLRCSDPKQKAAIKMIRDCRERKDLITKFCNIELDDDGRMRCHYDPAKTETGRLSSRKFYPTDRGSNLQNVPRDPRVRAVFVPDKGYIFAYADLKSAESLVVAHITGDPEMLRLHSPEYMSGSLDGHRYVASFLLDKPIDQINKDERYLGKRVRHAGNYGLGWNRLMQLINGDAQETGVSVDAKQAKLLINKYRQLHPFLKNWWDDVAIQLWNNHTLYTCHGRKRVFYSRPDECLQEAIAYNPQGTVAQTLNMGLLRCTNEYWTDNRGGNIGVMDATRNWMRLYDQSRFSREICDTLLDKCEMLQWNGFQLLLQVHDAIGFQVPEKNADKVLPLVRELMMIPIPIKRRGIEPYEITIPVEIQVGYNWGEHNPKKPDENPNGLRSWNG